MTAATTTGDLTLGHILTAAGIDLRGVVVIRHTYTADGLATAADLTSDTILDYTRRQGRSNKLGKAPLRLWLTFMADGGRRSRLLPAYDNHGEPRRLLQSRNLDQRQRAAIRRCSVRAAEGTCEE